MAQSSLIGNPTQTTPAQKNLKLIETLIKKHSNEGDTVLDTFSGVGTTLVACRNTNRKFKGCEIEKKYYKPGAGTNQDDVGKLLVDHGIDIDNAIYLSRNIFLDDKVNKNNIYFNKKRISLPETEFDNKDLIVLS